MRTDLIRHHPKLVALLQDLLEGQDLEVVASRYEVELKDLEAYAARAGLAKRRTARPTAAAPVADRAGRAERERLEEAHRRTHAKDRPPPEQAEDTLGELMRQQAAERAAELAGYESQPRPSMPLSTDPDFRIGFQTRERQLRDLARLERRRQEKLREWQSDPWNWQKPVPEDL